MASSTKRPRASWWLQRPTRRPTPERNVDARPETLTGARVSVMAGVLGLALALALGLALALALGLALAPHAMAAPLSIDPGGSPAAVACPSVNQCTAVDLAGQELTFDPQSRRAATH